MNIAATFGTHAATKNSGTEWLGNIPAEWDVKKMKFLFRDYSRTGMPNAELLSAPQHQGVVPRTWVENRMVMPSGNLESFKFIEKGDFAISLRSFEGGLEYCHHNGIISPAYTVLKRRSEELLPAYYRYLFKSAAFISELQTSIVGIREGKNISFEELSYSLMPIPSPGEQRAIAAFLDRKCVKIDEAVRIKEEQIELLRERKQILIQQAVTRGLNPGAPMKDSGIDWIGQIPAHWSVMPFTKFCKGIVDYRGKTPEKVEEGVLLVTAKNVREGFLDYEVSREYIKPSHYEMVMSRGKPKRGDILFTTEAPLGNVAVVDDETVALAQRIIKFRLKDDLVPEFVNFYLNSPGFQSNLATMGTGSTAMGIKASKLNQLLVIMPPKEEQNEVAQHLKNTTNKFYAGIAIKGSQISALREYKTSLINAAVTGKIKVI